MSSFSNLSLVCVHLFSLYEVLVYRGFYIIMTHAHHWVSTKESSPWPKGKFILDLFSILNLSTYFTLRLRPDGVPRILETPHPLAAHCHVTAWAFIKKIGKALHSIALKPPYEPKLNTKWVGFGAKSWSTSNHEGLIICVLWHNLLSLTNKHHDAFPPVTLSFMPSLTKKLST